jgi:exodeoxyribonuclease V alpha subunit
VSVFSPTGTARLRFLRRRENDASRDPLPSDDGDAIEPAYLGWEIARCAGGLDPRAQEALGALAAACVAAIQAGSTRIPVDEARLPIALEIVGKRSERSAALSLLARARQGDPAVCSVIGGPSDRRPLVLDGEWLSTERMCALEESFCERVRSRARSAVSAEDARAWHRAVGAIAEGPPRLTAEQKRAVRESLARPLGLVTGGPGTGKTTIVVAILRALAWAGVPMAQVAIAAPTGKAAQRLEESLGAGLSRAARDMADAALVSIAPSAQTIHRLLGWSPSAGRFSRHENDPLPSRVVIVDEASMIDLALMDRLFRALKPDARVVLLGDADQLPSIEAGAAFRDLCGTLGAARLTANLRVSSDLAGKSIIEVAAAVNAGSVDDVRQALGAPRASVRDVTFEGIEHLATRWEDAGEELLDRWWRTQASRLDALAPHVCRTYALSCGEFDADASASLDALLVHHQRGRFLCATRAKAVPTSADVINRQLLDRWRLRLPPAMRWRHVSKFCPGAPVLVERNDYERGLYNGDLGLVVQVDSGEGLTLFAAFKRRGAWTAFPLESLGELAPAFAMTVHKAQGSEHEEVVVVLPEVDMPLLTREWLYTALTRARRSVLVVGDAGLLACAVCRRVDRYSGIARKLGESRE